MTSRAKQAPWRPLFGLLFLCGVINGEISQSPEIVVPLGDTAQMDCHHGIAGYDGLFWYKHSRGAVPLSIISGFSTNRKGRLLMEVHSPNKSTKLSISKVEMQDDAIYYCAVRDGGRQTRKLEMIFGKGTKLAIKPNIEDSEPSVYKLKPRKGDNENLSACLITDYSPGNILAGLNGSLESISSSFVITSYGASYGTIVWDDKPGNFSCSASHKGKTYSDLTEDADGPPVEEFETDERLNFISITVLGLRVIFLKSVAINLLLTFRLWSC